MLISFVSYSSIGYLYMHIVVKSN